MFFFFFMTFDPPKPPPTCVARGRCWTLRAKHTSDWLYVSHHVHRVFVCTVIKKSEHYYMVELITSLQPHSEGFRPTFQHTAVQRITLKWRLSVSAEGGTLRAKCVSLFLFFLPCRFEESLLIMNRVRPLRWNLEWKINAWKWIVSEISINNWIPVVNCARTKIYDQCKLIPCRVICLKFRIYT